MRKIFLLAPLILLMGCQKYYLSLCQQWVDQRTLASTFVGTPDPRQKNPPTGQRIIINWRVPSEVFKKKPEVVLDVIYWDYTTKTIRYPIKYRLGTDTYDLLDKEYDQKGGILTYHARIVLEDGEVYREWKHQLWVELITVEDNTPAAD